MGWVVTKSLARLMADFRSTFPAKDRTSDGTIGDLAHQAETSGHNPDDTAGSRSEYTDADSIPEVRAIDVDNDLNAGITMQQVIDRMLQTPGDLKRLKYIIYNRRIWSRNTNWQPRAYTGSSPHTEHAHFSGDPAFDDDASPWTSVTSFSQEGDLVANASEIIEAWSGGFPTTSDGKGVAPVVWRIRDEAWQQTVTASLAANEQRDAATLAAVKALTVATGADPQPILNAIAQVGADTHAAIVDLQQQLAAVQARNLALARALAAAGGALDAADD